MSGDRPLSPRFIITLVLSVVCLAVPARANYEAGVDAYNREDYATAFRELTPLAENGDAFSEYFLGLMYAKGEGVPQIMCSPICDSTSPPRKARRLP